METEAKTPEKKSENRASSAWVNNLLIPVLAVLTGLIAGGVIIAVTNVEAMTAWEHVFQFPGAAIATSWNAVLKAYGALFLGALGNPKEIYIAFQTYFATGKT